MKLRAILVWVLWSVSVCCGTAARLYGQQTAPAPAGTSAEAKVIEQGSFRLHKFEQAIGEETYTIVQASDGLTVQSNFKFKDRFTEVPLTAKLRIWFHGPSKSMARTRASPELTTLSPSTAMQSTSAKERRPVTSPNLRSIS
jgi:hypothetical protein